MRHSPTDTLEGATTAAGNLPPPGPSAANARDSDPARLDATEDGDVGATGPGNPDGTDDDGDDPWGDGPWVTVATFWQPPAAHIARLRLESSGIDCALLDENLIATDWLLANAAGGIKLQVPAPQATRAVQLLSQRRGAGITAAPEGEPLFDGQARCPKCGGGDVYRVRLARRMVFLSMLLLGAPLPILARRTRCASCGFEWR